MAHAWPRALVDRDRGSDPDRYFGLVTAAQNYSLREGATFASYAGIRIRAPSSTICARVQSLPHDHRNAEKGERRSAGIAPQLGREPTTSDIADLLQISDDEMQTWQHAFQANVHQSLDSVYDDFSVWFESPENTPEENINEEELRSLLKEALRTLPEREALVIQLYYVEELNVYEIAKVLEVTTGRVADQEIGNHQPSPLPRRARSADPQGVTARHARQLATDRQDCDGRCRPPKSARPA